MILEWLQSLVTPAPRHIRSLGYVYEAVAIEARHARCQQAWAPHLENSQNLILETIARLEVTGHILIIGSGGLHDVPLKALSSRLQTITLWDIVHTRRALRTAASLPNVICQSIDVTGLCEDFHDSLAGKRPDLPVSAPPPLPTDPPALVVSLNLLSQLPVQLEARAETRNRALDLGRFANDVIKAHVNWLKSLPCPVLLLTDIERHYKTGNILEIEDVLPELDLGAPVQDWLWDIAPKGEATGHDSIQHKVAAFLLNVPD